MDRIDLDALIDDAKAHFEAAEPVDQEVMLGKKLVIVRIWPIPSPDWRDLIAQHPWRPNSALDHNLGFNADAVVLAFPKLSLVVDGRVDDMMREDEQGKRFSKWPSIYAQLGGADLKNLAMAVWGIHEYENTKALAAAGKASTGERKPRKRSSPANSGSPSANSTGGRQRRSR